jgi:hypothetical protein
VDALSTIHDSITNARMPLANYALSKISTSGLKHECPWQNQWFHYKCMNALSKINSPSIKNANALSEINAFSTNMRMPFGKLTRSAYMPERP